jgi:D-alanyl-D-alanine carboxypeptidase (penicillin-binding protein 5/6)
LLFFTAFTLFAGTALAAPPEYTGDMNDDFAVVLIDADTGTVLYKQNEDEQIEPASTTKIMTCILAIDNSNMDDKVTISKKAANSRTGSILGIKENEEIKMLDLLTGMMLASGNDAAIAVAEAVSGSVDDFAALMNEKAKSLGMDSTNFVTPNGLHVENHHTTASDMAKLAYYAMKNETFRDIVKKASYEMPETNKQKKKTVDNTNWLLKPPNNHADFAYEYATGIKTGSTPYAGGCLVSSASKDGMNLICLIFGEKPSSKTKRWTISKTLFEWGFENFKTVDVTALIKPAEPAQIQEYAVDDLKHGLLDFTPPSMSKIYATLPKEDAQKLLGGTDTIEAVTTYDKDLVAPIAKGDIMGAVTYTIKSTGDIVYSYNLIASRDILEETASSTSPVITMAPTPPPKQDTSDNSLYIIFMIAIPVGLIVFLIIRMISSRRRRHHKKRRKPHYSYRK